MALFHFSCSQIHHPAPPRLSILKPNKPTSQTPLPRDTIIDFGKYKGRMLGSLPSKYLHWVSRTLRARDFERWARLADAVLRDPVYRDRIEWETAEHVLGAGDGLPKASSSSTSRTESAVEELADISERFGWDYGDRDGWARVDFGLLGTSLGARIPRVGKSLDGDELGIDQLGCSRSDRRSMISAKGGVLEGDSMGSSGMGWRSKTGAKDGILGGDSVVEKRGEIASSSGYRLSGFRKGEKGSSRMVWRSKLPEKSGILGEDSSVSPMCPLKETDLEAGKDLRKVGFLSSGQRYHIGEEQGAMAEEEEELVVRRKREERRERRRLQREQQLEMMRREVGGVSEVGEEKSTRRVVNDEVSNPFPGRRTLLDKIIESRGKEI